MIFGLLLSTTSFSRTNEEKRAFLKGLFELPADILTDEASGKMIIKFHSMANPRSNRALKDLCDIMNSEEYRFPQTTLHLVFEAPDVAS